MYWHKAPYQMRSLLSARDRTIRQLKLNLKDKQQAINNYEFSVSKLKEWVRIYKVLRDAHKNHRRKLEADRDEYRNLYHLGEAKITSREAIIEQLSETGLAKDVTRLEAENEALKKWADHKSGCLSWRSSMQQNRPCSCGLDALLTGEDDEKQDENRPIYLTQKEFDSLGEYSASIPTGQTIGKCWKSHLRTGEWVHREYAEHPTDDSMILIRTRDIIIRDD